VEALTIVLAAGVTRGWRSAIAGARLGTASLTTPVLVFGPRLQIIPMKTFAVVRKDLAAVVRYAMAEEGDATTSSGSRTMRSPLSVMNNSDNRQLQL
jgi:hypothetical protein